MDRWDEISIVAIVGICCQACAGGGEDPSGQSGAGGATAGDSGTCSLAMAPPAPGPGMIQGPCDIYADDGGPCVAAHSTVRALYGGYSGPLYQVRKADGSTKDIGVLASGGLANAADHDAFCGTSTCTISIIYDQSGMDNHLTQAPPGGAKPTAGNEADAKGVSIMIGGQKVYGVQIVPGVGYRNNAACGTATGDNPQTVYMVVAGNFFNGGCCFDYGNMERNSRDNGPGTMEAVYFGDNTLWGRGAGDGPWVMGDLEEGLFAGDTTPYEGNEPLIYDPVSGVYAFVTGMVKGEVAGRNHWTIKTGDAGSGALATAFDGQRPSGYNPMRKEGAIGLGTGGDNSNSAQGNFFEGLMTTAYSSDAGDDAVQANIVSVYGQ